MTRRKYIQILFQTGILSSLVSDAYSINLLKTDSEVFFDKTQFKYLKTLCQTIIPTTNTIGSEEAGVPHFVDLYMYHMASADQQKTFKEMFEAYISRLKQSKINPFKASVSLTSQMSIDEKGEHRAFIKALKVMVLKGYFMNEKALRQHFQYVAVPGNYKADIKKSELGKIWIN